mmetsp:Transcript_14952/g.16224  ORF Transcript_14952/g.16224 Transcript_14952/m.16224 type:complete len:83 (-) Transcript_14952:75-323(-)
MRLATTTLRCRLPSGEVTQIQVSMGQDVAHAKAMLSKQLDVPYSELSLHHEGKLMFDPLSFNDFPQLDSARGMDVEVKISSK